jgi:hypothetical protein
MNGISLTLKEEIKKTIDLKKKEKFKFIGAILTTNLLVAMICTPSSNSTVAVKENKRIFHPNYQVMIMPLQALVSSSEEDAAETTVTLLSKDKKIIAEKAYLIPMLQKLDLPQSQV